MHHRLSLISAFLASWRLLAPSAKSPITKVLN
jgi:hypothetical protein